MLKTFQKSFISVSRNDYLDDAEDMPDDEGIPDFPEADIPLFLPVTSPKDEEDINELQELAHKYLNLSENI